MSEEVLKKALQKAREVIVALAGQARPVAIIGLGCLLPAGESDARTLEDFGQSLFRETLSLGPFPEERLALWRSSGNWGDKTPYPAAFLKRWPLAFDLKRLNLTEAEARVMDPNIPLALEIVQDALDNAGLDPRDLAGQGVGVYFGKSSLDFPFDFLANQAQALDDPYGMLGNAPSSLSGRVSYHFDFQGPCLHVETACSTGLVAVALAYEAIIRGQADLAVAGALNLMIGPSAYRWLVAMGALAPDGRVRAFGAEAKGFARGEGAGAVILKDLKKAQEDGNRILAVIEGLALGSDGRSSGFSAPSSSAQARVMGLALREARLEPSQVGAVEAHGTGTKLGDPLEVEALTQVYGRGERPAPLIIGSVKSNIGHLEGAAGLASLLKAIVMVREGIVPKSLGSEELNPLIDWSPAIEVAQTARPWPSGYERRVVGVSSFGVSGSLAHLLLAEAPPSPVQRETFQKPVNVYLSAPSDEGLRLRAQDVGAVLAQADLGVLARSSGQISSEPERLVLTSEDWSEAIQTLKDFSHGQNPPNLVRGRAKTLKIAFAYGSLEPSPGRGQELRAIYPVFDQSLKRFAEASQEVFGPRGEELQAKAFLDQWAFQLALTDLLADLDLQPTAMVASASGHLAALVGCGAWSLRSALEALKAALDDFGHESSQDWPRLPDRLPAPRLLFARLMANLKIEKPKIPFLSLDLALDLGDLGYKTLADLPAMVGLELGALSLANQGASQGPWPWLAAWAPGREGTQFLESLGQLWALGSPARPNPPGPVWPIMPPRRPNYQIFEPSFQPTAQTLNAPKASRASEPPQPARPAPSQTGQVFGSTALALAQLQTQNFLALCQDQMNLGLKK